ncbi:MAG: hypothetical protein JJU24_04175 [Natronohydrobacter sp.]|nr:hypothetical protein [Natronohydrobacter sp.]
MGMLVWIGAIVSLLGVIGLAWCIIYVMRLRRLELEDAAMRARMQKAVLVNFAALAVSTLGLMMVVIGIALG